MDTIELRGKGEFCLRLLQLWTDGSLAGRLSYLAARYHEAALRAEFGVSAEGRADASRTRGALHLAGDHDSGGDRTGDC
jgi:hypothetical protein